MTAQNKRVGVICKSYAHYRHFLHNISHDDRHTFHWISKIDDVRGMEFSHVISLVGYGDMDNYHELLQRSKTRIK